MKQFLNYVFLTLMLQQTGNDTFDTFVFWSSFYLELAAAIGVVVLVIRNEPVRKRLRTQDRLIFWECVLVFAQNVLDMSLVPLVQVEADWEPLVFYVALTVNEVLFFLIILQWLVCVDYSLHHSLDHIRRRYRHAAIPIAVIILLDIIHDMVASGTYGFDAWGKTGGFLLYTLKLVVEIGYILTAVILVKRYEKERREPRFLRLDAFIIPFVAGSLVRFYDAPFLGFGVILTYAAMKRRDRYIDFQTGLYNDLYLDCISEYWDNKGFDSASALLISASGHGEAMAGILQNIKIPDCFIIHSSADRFILLTGAVRNSALKMSIMLLTDAARESDPSFKPVIKTMRRMQGQTMKEFAAEIRSAYSEAAPCMKGGAQVL